MTDLKGKGLTLNKTVNDFDKKESILSTTMMVLVLDCEHKRDPGKDYFNLFWTRSMLSGFVYIKYWDWTFD